MLNFEANNDKCKFHKKSECCILSLFSGTEGDAEDIVQSDRINKMYAESKFSFCYNKSIFNEQ